MKLKGLIYTGISIIMFGIVILVVGLFVPSFSLKNINFGYYELIEYKYNYDEIDNISIDCEADNIEIRYAYEYKEIKLICKDGDNISYDVVLNTNTSTLSIEQNLKPALRINLGYSINDALIIEVPALVQLSYDISCEVGEVVIDGGYVKNCSIEMSVGTLDINNSNISDLDINIEVGEINTNELFLTNGNIDLSCGSCILNINPVLLLDVKVSVGTIKMDLELDEEYYTINNTGNGYIKVNAEVELGKVKYIWD